MAPKVQEAIETVCDTCLKRCSPNSDRVITLGDRTFCTYGCHGVFEQWTDRRLAAKMSLHQFYTKYVKKG